MTAVPIPAVLDAPARGRIGGDAALRLAVWEYAEHSVLRLLCAWGRSAEDWEDKLAVCYHVWLQAEIVDRLRRRLGDFPPHKPELPVSRSYEDTLNAVLLAPSWPDAVWGIYGAVNPTLASAYAAYRADSHPVHDRPTHELLTEILDFKRIQADWFTGFQSRRPHAPNPAYTASVTEALASVGLFQTFAQAEKPFAAPCGKNTGFRMPQTPGRVPGWDAAPNIMPFLEKDWAHRVETRRLYFMIGYMREMGLAEDQLRWLFYADFMPWEFIYAEARHLWDESRHGDSGLTRLADFGLGIQDVGYDSYGKRGDGTLAPMTPCDLYEAFYSVTQVAERGYFKTKTYCMEDFAAGRDAASAEMMQFDIIDETTHVEYGRLWMAVLAERVGVTEDWLRRGAMERDAAQRASDVRAEALRRDDAQLDPKAHAHYERLLEIIRSRCPLANAETAPPRPNLPM